MGAGNPEIAFRLLPVVVLGNTETFIHLFQTCPRMYHTVLSPPPQLSQNSGISLSVHRRMLTPNQCEISLCQGISRRGTAHPLQKERAKQEEEERRTQRDPGSCHHLVSIPGLCIYFRCGTCHFPSGWRVKDSHSGDPSCNGQHCGCRSQDCIPGFHENTMIVGQPLSPRSLQSLAKILLNGSHVF